MTARAPRSLAFRLVAGAAFWVVLGFGAGAVLLSTLFRAYVERGFDARLSLMLDGLVAASEATADGGVRLSRGLQDPRFERPYSGWYWQIATAEGPVARSHSLWNEALAVAPPGDDRRPRHAETTGPGGRQVRLLTRTITLPGSDGLYAYTVAGDRAEIARETAAFHVALAWSLGGLGLVLVTAVFVQVRIGLRPLRRIPPALAAIRSGRAERLAGAFPAEVAPLAAEINALLEHNRAVVARARTHVGNLAHALKTPLAVLTNEAEAASGPLAGTVLRQAAAMRRQVSHHLARAHAAARSEALGAATPVMPVIDDLRRTLARIHSGRELRVEVEGEAEAAFRGERQDLEEMLGNLMDNGCKWARARVAVAVAREGGRVVIRVEDDGPGLAPEARAAALERGQRLDEAVPGMGLGLSIVRDLAALYGGGLTLGDSTLGGLAAVLSLPAAEAA